MNNMMQIPFASNKGKMERSMYVCVCMYQKQYDKYLRLKLLLTKK